MLDPVSPGSDPTNIPKAQQDETPLKRAVIQTVTEKSVELLAGVLITCMNKRLLNQGHNCHANGLQYGQCFPPVFLDTVFLVVLGRIFILGASTEAH